MTKTLVGAGDPSGQPPAYLCDQHAERAVLGAMLQHRTASRHLVAVLEEGDFSVPAHREVFAAAAAAAAHGRRTDPLNVAAELKLRAARRRPAGARTDRCRTGGGDRRLLRGDRP